METIDDDSIKNSKADISNDNGYNFGPATRLVAFFLVGFGVVAILTGGAGYILGPLVAAAGLFALTSKHGTEISLSNNYIREYNSIIGIKSGKWQSTLMLPDICVLKIGKTQGVANVRTGGTGFESDVSKNEVFLMTANHRKRVLVKTCNSKKEAYDYASELAVKMGKNFTEFNPPVSEKSRARR